MKFYLNGSWQQRDERIDVLNPFDGQVVDTVPKATVEDTIKPLFFVSLKDTGA